MKKLLGLLLLFGTRAIAQMPQADMNITGAGQPLYLTMEGVKNNKVSLIRETEYEVDTTSHQPNLQKIKRITLYSIAYFGTTPLLVKQLAALGSDTNKLVRNEEYSYNPSTGLLIGYQSASNDGFEMGVASQVARDQNGLVTGKSTAITFNLKQPAKPTDYKVMCSAGPDNKVRSVIVRSIENGKEVMERISMEYDGQGRLTNSIFDNADGSSDKVSASYDSKDHLKQQQRIYTRKTTEYKPGSEGGVYFGVYVPPTKPSQVQKMVSDTSSAAFEYDTKGNLTTASYVYRGKPTGKDVYTYSATGLLETCKGYNGLGQLSNFKKFICK